MAEQQTPAPAPRFHELLTSVISSLTPMPSTLVSLIAMRETDPFASQDLAMQFTRDFGLARSITVSYAADADSRRNNHPVSVRDVIDHWGFRVTHSTSVLTGLLGLLGNAAASEANRGFWLRATAIASYAGLLGDVLKLHADEAFSASLLRSTALFLLQDRVPAEAQSAKDLADLNGTPLWDAEAELLGGSHLDIARALSEHWGLTDRLLAAFEPGHQPDSMADLMLRATAAAERHGFRDPNGSVVPPRLRPDREPIVDAYFRNGGGTPDAFIEYIGGMLGLTRLLDIDSAA